MTQKVKFNAGEGLLADDFTNMQSYVNRTIQDGLATHLATSKLGWLNVSGYVHAAEVLRPFGLSGAMLRDSATHVRVCGGAWLYNANTSLVSASGPKSTLVFDNATRLLAVAAAGGGQFRRDLIQARVVEADDAAISRHFKDAVTGALSTQTFVKRSAFSIEFAIKQGVQQGTLLAAVEPTVDSGYIRVGSVAADSAGVMASEYIYDWRMPVGDSSEIVTASDMFTKEGAGKWDKDVDGFAHHYVATLVGGHNLIADIGRNCSLYEQKDSFGSVFPRRLAKRVTKLTVSCDYVAAPAAADIELLRFSQAFAPTYVGEGTLTALLDLVGDRVTSTSRSEFELYDTYGTGFYLNDPPLWTNGSFNPLSFSSNRYDEMLVVRFAQVSVGDKIYRLKMSAAG